MEAEAANALGPYITDGLKYVGAGLAAIAMGCSSIFSPSTFKAICSTVRLIRTARSPVRFCLAA